MRAILVIDEAGIPQASVGFETIDESAPLFGSFLSAMLIFTKSVDGTIMDELILPEVRLLLGRVEQYNIITFHTSKDPDADWNHSVVLDLITEQSDRIDDNFLVILRELLSSERFTKKQAKICIDMISKSNDSCQGTEVSLG